jgi:hypothetical protein
MHPDVHVRNAFMSVLRIVEANMDLQMTWFHNLVNIIVTLKG